MDSEISVNRKALRDFHVLERFEAGLELKGTEVKSIRSGHANLLGAFARVEKGQVYLFDLEIRPYGNASHTQHESKTRRRLLLHRQQIAKLFDYTHIKGHALVALRLYWKGHRIKVEIAVGSGKDKADQRASLKERVELREVQREVSRFNRGARN
ncbi:MAG: SsrA-binding protein SmpB [Verrucomicrobiota bacterium]|jgi:SsrA-binding protein|nr:SsrA-binding protein SmpB [Pseudomonadota bacterium]